MDLNIAHAHLSRLQVIFTLAFAIQALDYITHTDVLQTPVLNFAATKVHLSSCLIIETESAILGSGQISVFSV